jgi:hypothetical protein
MHETGVVGPPDGLFSGEGSRRKARCFDRNEDFFAYTA